MANSDLEDLFLEQVDLGGVCPAESPGALDHGNEHALQVRRRAHGAQDLASGVQLLACLRQFAPKAAHFVDGVTRTTPADRRDAHVAFAVGVVRIRSPPMCTSAGMSVRRWNFRHKIHIVGRRVHGGPIRRSYRR